MFDYDATGIEPSTQGQSKLLPKQWFTFEVVEYTTNDGSKTYPMEGFTKDNNYPKVDMLVEVVDPGEYEGQRVFHTVTFIPKNPDGTAKPGAGMAIHWLKTINQPFEGNIKPDCKAWVGEQFMGYAIEDEYKGKKKNKLGEIKPLDDLGIQPPLNPEIKKAQDADTVPF